MKNKQHLIWIDLEMTGLSPEQDRIIEIATIVTDKHLNILDEGPVFAIHQSDEPAHPRCFPVGLGCAAVSRLAWE